MKLVMTAFAALVAVSTAQAQTLAQEFQAKEQQEANQWGNQVSQSLKSKAEALAQSPAVSGPEYFSREGDNIVGGAYFKMANGQVCQVTIQVGHGTSELCK